MSAKDPSIFRAGDVSIAFVNAYQPIVDVSNGSVYAYESLVRGALGQSPMSVFKSVPRTLTSRLDQAIREAAITRAVALGIDTRLTLNISSECLISEEQHTLKTIEHARSVGFPVDKLIFEISESDVIHGIPRLVDVLQKINSAGATLALDDFGAGYAGLNSLIDVNPDIIKLDMYLIRDIHRSGPRQATIRALVSLTEELGIEIIAEGVETLEEYDFLKDNGIELYQGYLFAKPGLCELPQLQRLPENPLPSAV